MEIQDFIDKFCDGLTPWNFYQGEGRWELRHTELLMRGDIDDGVIVGADNVDVEAAAASFNRAVEFARFMDQLPR